MVIRITRDDKLADSKCCAICTAMMKAVNITRVYYSDKEGKIVCQKVSSLKMTFISSGTKRIAHVVTGGDPVKLIIDIVEDHRKHPP